MTGRNDQLVDPVQRLGLQPIEVVANAPPVKADVTVPVADAHDLPQRPMLLGQVLQFVKVEIAPETHGRQHDDLPVVHSFATALATAVPIDVLADPFQNLLTQRRFTVNVLQGAQDRDDLVATLQVEFHIRDGSRTQAGLRIEWETHGIPSVKIVAESVENCGIRHYHDPLALNLREGFPKKAQQNGFFAFPDRL